MDPFASARRLFLKRISRYGLSLALLAGAKPALSKSVTALTGIRISQSAEDHTRVVFDLSGGIEHRLFTLDDPHRVVIDLHNTRESEAIDINRKSTNLMRGIRSASKDNGRLRVVLDLKGKARPRSFELKPDGKSGHRLVVDLHATKLSPTPIITSQQERKQRKKQFIIALDPGHGGRDPGAIGKKGTREKDVALSVAKKMKTLINRTSGYRAILTREGDRFVSLRNRVKKAREAEADIFVSLHSNSFHSPNAKGASVYALSLRGASSEAARWIAEKENASDLIGGISLDDKDDLIASVLLDLSQTATIQDSLELGSDVLRHLGKISKLNNKKVQQAGFAVLKAPDMPSILIETAFLSNPAEERKLRNPKHQHKLAKAVFSGIRNHLKNRQT
ncbi:MAG: N-acetylmuramoyl-L-alanine amidase [Gammaproteobacteria bacterium]|nr:MAG: N-acetylmuramoyl-L-alanine amidase [Gammaproteobacteria bacterium]UCH39991.1 MAG: N-acetylmuramoyl-L-alanine amidase [Gammaproteobacteria bacterium]